MAGSFTYYNAGHNLGGSITEHDLFMFTCWNESHTSCGCHSVYEPDVKRNIAALEKGGSINRTERGERWDYTERAWVPVAQVAHAI